ncbi:hypothetical protein LUZ61_004858 [Rhynchospora tenuis]|uniref:Uncharacterized protein n=1 Tax=Rhynchospora tenuis TaxID=198213 RepID=A0AAD5ZNL1_9POAL|nr:hypothetical protein LUZ61_004858 [Rhynchospora tenuis]
MGLDPSGSTQVFIWKDGTVPYWRSGEWNGAANFLGIPWVPLYSKGFFFEIEGDQKYYTFTASNDSLVRFVLHWNGMKLPDHTERVPSIGDSVSCQNYCSGNCSCNAYAYVSTVGCMTWSGDLIDLYHFDNGGYDLYVKVPRGNLGSIHILKEATRAFLRSKEDCQKKSQIEDEEEHIGNNLELPSFTFDCIVAATSNFSSSNKLGEGGFGPVYKGKLPNGEEIAVKRLSATSRQGVEEFKNEVMLIAKLQHRNLVRLLGCCIQGEKLLVYEYLPNKSLDVFLFDPSKRELLNWDKRFNIIEGIATGLLYLHRDSRLRVVHRDLKASNILLDNNMDPKISDFGMARIFGGDQNQENTLRVVGTLGYMSPEYAMDGIFSVKSDVYSFGILILEIIMGKRNSSFRNEEDSLNIVGYVSICRPNDIFKLQRKELLSPTPLLCLSSFLSPPLNLIDLLDSTSPAQRRSLSPHIRQPSVVLSRLTFATQCLSLASPSVTVLPLPSINLT